MFPAATTKLDFVIRPCVIDAFTGPSRWTAANASRMTPVCYGYGFFLETVHIELSAYDFFNLINFDRMQVRTICVCADTLYSICLPINENLSPL